MVRISRALLFGNFQLVTYTGTVYNDLNGSGVIAPGDPGLPGWTVELLDSNGNVLETTTSASDGSYSFPDMGPGVYTIEEINQTGWDQTEPQQPLVYTITATSGASQSRLDFGNFQLVNVSGNVYNDLNSSGNLDPGDPGLQGWTVNLEDQSGNIVATTVSDANGNYEFDNLFPGTFIVEDVLQTGWIQTQPVSPNYYAFATQSGTNETGLNFGNFKSGTFTGTVPLPVFGTGLSTSGALLSTNPVPTMPSDQNYTLVTPPSPYTPAAGLVGPAYVLNSSAYGFPPYVADGPTRVDLARSVRV